MAFRQLIVHAKFFRAPARIWPEYVVSVGRSDGAMARMHLKDEPAQRIPTPRKKIRKNIKEPLARPRS
jgi:hypothetical protein